MEPIEFACVLDEITKKLAIKIDSDIIGKIYDIYEGSYENYTLLELINLLEIERITCSWNKKTIIETIKNHKLNIAKKYEPIEPTEWICHERRCSLGSIHIDCIYTDKTYFEFNEGDMFQISNGNIYIIDDIQKSEDDYNYEQDQETLELDSPKEIVHIYLRNINTEEQICIYAEDFIYTLDYHDITILQNDNRCLYYDQK
jgi:hypothetical protein